MSSTIVAEIFFFYGLAFFSLGLATLLELGRASDPRLRYALRMLSVFGLVHGGHEWLEMFESLGILPAQLTEPLLWRSLRIMVLAGSFLPLGGFGAALLVRSAGGRRWSLGPSLGLALVWGLGLLILRTRFTEVSALWDVADVWTRYTLAVPSAVLAGIGLLSLRHSFRAAGMAGFGRDSLFAALAFMAYGVIGQVFTRPSALPPSTVINSELFFETFGFPIQLLRTGGAILITVFVIRFMRSFEVEQQQRMAELQDARLQEAERRQALRGELLHRVVQAQEAERERIARELHDETGQALTAIGLGLRGVVSKLPEGVNGSVGALRHLEELTNSSLAELQRLILGLRPSHLDDLGLVAALRWYAGEIENRAPLIVSFEVVGDERSLPPLLKVGLFRVAQEALTNVVRHASAQQAWVRLSYNQVAVCLEVEDDGVGFNTVATGSADRPSWGLMGMQERVTLMGGAFDLSSEIGKGTRIVATVPDRLQTGDEHDSAAAAG